MKQFGAILLAGGQGKRLGEGLPKQYREIARQPLAKYALDVFLKCPGLIELIIVAEPRYYPLFISWTDSFQGVVRFASPGERRQDSVWNGLNSIESAAWICVHDLVRPFVKQWMIESVVDEAVKHGAAAIGIPIHSTIKSCNSHRLVEKTLDRSSLWEVQTPQCIKKELLHQAFKYAFEKGVVVTDDLGLVEQIGHPAYLVKGERLNFKITTPEDLELAHWIVLQNMKSSDALL